MHDAENTSEELRREVAALRRRVAELEAAMAHRAPAPASPEADDAESKQAAEALRQSEQRYRILVEESLQGLSIVTKDYIRVYANTTLATMLGYERSDDLIGLHVWDDVVPSSLEILKRYGEARRQGESTPTWYTYQRRKRDGTPIWIEQRTTPIPWEGELAYLTTMVDVSDRKQAEEALQHAHDTLELRVAERTAALQHTNHQLQAEIAERQQAEEARQRLADQLRQAQKMEAIGTLTGGIAHEFNNILAMIIGFAELASFEATVPPPVTSHLEQVLTAGHRAKDLVQQLLAFSHPSPRDRKPVQITSVVREAFTLLRATLPSTIDLRLHLPSETAIVVADVTQLHQVLMNLCANADYAMRETGGLLEIGVDQVEIDAAPTPSYPSLPPGNYSRLWLRDTGPGMSSDVIDRIFEPFFTTKAVGEGSGMGLAIVHGIISSHGGAISVESTPGEGSTFTLYLPQSAKSVAEAAPSHHAQPLPQGSGRILFVDDEEGLARLGQTLLERLGYEVVVSTRSQEALDRFQAEPDRFDLVITDQTMPELTGAMLAAELRHIRPDIPIILSTGFSHLMNASAAQAQGVDAFVMKPAVAQDWARTIQQVLAQRAGPGS